MHEFFNLYIAHHPLFFFVEGIHFYIIMWNSYSHLSYNNNLCSLSVSLSHPIFASLLLSTEHAYWLHCHKDFPYKDPILGSHSHFLIVKNAILVERFTFFFCAKMYVWVCNFLLVKIACWVTKYFVEIL